MHIQAFIAVCGLSGTIIGHGTTQAQALDAAYDSFEGQDCEEAICVEVFPASMRLAMALERKWKLDGYRMVAGFADLRAAV